MDLSSIEFSETATMKLRHPITGEILKDDNGDEMFITVYGPQSGKYRNAILSMQRKSLADGDEHDADAETVNILSSLTVDWNIQLNGKNPKCSADSAKKLYGEPKNRWITNAVDVFMHERRNFFTEASSA